WTSVAVSAGADTAVTGGSCYRYRIRVSDNLGSPSANPPSSADAKVDPSAPSAPSLAPSESSSLSYASGTTLYYNAQGSNSASFTAGATSSDAQSAIQKINFPSVSGMTGGGDDKSNPYHGTSDGNRYTNASG